MASWESISLPLAFRVVEWNISLYNLVNTSLNPVIVDVQELISDSALITNSPIVLGLNWMTGKK